MFRLGVGEVGDLGGGGEQEERVPFRGLQGLEFWTGSLGKDDDCLEAAGDC